MHLALINLDAAVERRRHMTAQLDALEMPFRRFGFDGRTLSTAAIAQWAGRHFPHVEFDADELSGAEIGCWLSHLMAWRWFCTQTMAPSCAVIEDDLILSAGLAATLAELADPSPYDVIFLGTSSRNISNRRRVQVGSRWVHAPVGAIFNTWGYVVSRQYAERVLAVPRLQIRAPIDHLLGGSAQEWGPRLGVVQPPSVWEYHLLGRESQIEPHTFRLDRWRVVEAVRRRFLGSRLGEMYYSVYRLL